MTDPQENKDKSAFSPVQTEYHGDQFLDPKESMIGTQGVQSSDKKAQKSSAELAQKRRYDEERLAEDIIEECRVQLMLKFRFLDRALWRMELICVRSGLDRPLATDGHNIYYDPQMVIARFNQSFDECVRDYLHMIMHCIFRHPYDRDHKEFEAWNLTCDMIVESVVMDLCALRFPSEDDDQRREALDQIALVAGSLLPNKLYDFLKGLVRTPSGQQYMGLGRSHLNVWHAIFERDDHHAWPSQMDSENQETSDNPEEMEEDNENPDIQNDSMQTSNLGDEDEPQPSFTSEDAEEDDDSDPADEADEDSDSEESARNEDHEHDEDRDEQEEADEDTWEDISKELEMNLETFSKEWGEEAGNLIANLQITNRRKYDYNDFLRKFMTITEQIKLNPEEFDYTYYVFGLDNYDNMPFIEPLEYKESESIRDFAIVIDTSESVKGDLVKKFIEHTFSILAESRNASTKVNIHLIQADSKVQSDLKIEDLNDIDKLMDGFALRGFGGTDFRPAFDYVQMLRDRGELSDLKGMIYFTDGYGMFPEKTPDYDAAFVFVDDGSRELPPVPPWAAKLVIDERDIERMR